MAQTSRFVTGDAGCPKWRAGVLNAFTWDSTNPRAALYRGKSLCYASRLTKSKRKKEE